MRGLEHLSYEERLTILGMFITEKAWMNLIHKYLIQGSKDDRVRSFSMVFSDSMKGNGHKLKYRESHLNMKAPDFNHEGSRTVQHFARGVKEPPSLTVIKVQLDMFLVTLGCYK